MAQGLQLSQRMALSQVLAPQLQQSLALLQAPTLELKALVEQELQMNPVLEEEMVEEQNEDSKESNDSESNADREDDFGQDTQENDSEPVDDFQAEFEKLVQLDNDWRDHFSQTNIPLRNNQDEEEKRQFMFDSLVASTSLQETLQDQIRMSELDGERKSIAEMITGNIDDFGYLQASVEELAFSTNIDPSKIQEVLKVVQSFHPPGVGARNLKECLLLQLERAESQNTMEYLIVSRCFDALGKRRMPEIARQLDADVYDVQKAVERIGNLEPRPGRAFMPDNNQYIMPEVFVQKVGEEFVVTTNNDHVPHLRISNTYKDLMANAQSSSEVREYIRDKIRAGKFLIKSLNQRQETILNIGKEIVSRQREFMEHGVSKLKPLTMVMVAEVVGVHETTVSRAVSGKYIMTPQGIFEMKYFFTSGIQTSNGTGVSNTSVKELIADMIRKEDPHKPLSDEEIVRMLSEKEIKIARRTVAKYRSELNVLPSHLRKVYS